MNENLRKYIEGLFANAPKTKQTVEIKEEILQNTIDRYNDLIAEGKTEEAAYNISVAGIGDVTHLINEIGTQSSAAEPSSTEIAKTEKKRAVLLAISVMLYILSLLPVIFLDETKYADTLGVALMFIIVAIATGLIIYRNSVRLNYRKSDGTVVEDFKEWSRESKEKNTARQAVNGSVWAVTLVIYIVVSIITGAWYITWLIIPIGRCITGVISEIFNLTK